MQTIIQRSRKGKTSLFFFFFLLQLHQVRNTLKGLLKLLNIGTCIIFVFSFQRFVEWIRYLIKKIKEGWEEEAKERFFKSIFNPCFNFVMKKSQHLAVLKGYIFTWLFWALWVFDRLRGHLRKGWATGADNCIFKMPVLEPKPSSCTKMEFSVSGSQFLQIRHVLIRSLLLQETLE